MLFRAIKAICVLTFHKYFVGITAGILPMFAEFSAIRQPGLHQMSDGTLKDLKQHGANVILGATCNLVLYQDCMSSYENALGFPNGMPADPQVFINRLTQIEVTQGIPGFMLICR